MREKTLVVGDLHCKMSLVLPRITDVALVHCCDSIVLTGDLCDDWSVGGPAMVRQLQFAVDWKAKLEALGLGLDILVGNHDSAYIGMRHYHFTRLDVADVVRGLLIERLGVRAAVALRSFLVTHAGVTAAWARANGIHMGLSSDQVARSLNDMFDDTSRMHRLSSCGPWRGGHAVPGPLWADRRELDADPYPGISQIVGHSPVDTILHEETEEGDSLWFIDTVSIRSSGLPVGDATALIIDEEGLQPVPLFDNWEESVVEYCAQ